MQLRSFGAVIMIGAGGSTPAEQLYYQASQAALLDLLDVLHAQGIQPVVVAGPDLSWLPEMPQVIHAPDEEAFHFGERLAGLIEQHNLSPMIYLGAASAPLLNLDMLNLVHGLLARSEFEQGSRIPSHIALTNNLHSSDWLALTQAQDALDIIRTATRDNSLAWMLQENWDYDVRVISGVRPASSMDLDTPADLALVQRHPNCPPHLAEALRDPLLARIPVDAIVDVLARDAGRLALIGRVGPLAWQALNKATRCWMRVFSEERGMVASERLLRGEVHSVMGRLYELLGPDGFFAELAEVADAAIIDSRVLMAASGHYPERADRFASDLLLAEDVQDEWVRRFTEAAANAPLPVLLGGHGVVSGGLYVLADIVNARA